MDIKRQVINESISRIEKRLNEINKIFNSNPLSEICKIRIEAQELLEQNKTIEQRTSKEFIEKIDVLAKKEKKLINFAKKQRYSVELIDEQVELESQLRDLNNELFHMNRK